MKSVFLFIMMMLIVAASLISGTTADPLRSPKNPEPKGVCTVIEGRVICPNWVG
uniref:Uncharacterized protein n=1 Tax=Anopheles minimus TaxID=112268 RepID=A0A182WN83_9DIPT